MNGAGGKGGQRTVSKLTLILPTFVAPTGTMLKNPYFHLPRRATRSLRTKRLCNLLAIYGDTEKSSPKDEDQVVCHSVRSRSKERTNEMPALFYDPSRGTVEPMVVAGGEVDNAEEKGMPGPDAGS